jgi:hypothetical protein
VKLSREFETALLRFHQMEKAHPELNHNGHEPQAQSFGFGDDVLSQWEVNQIRKRVEREVNRE